MKILGISLFMFILLAGISTAIDLLKGFELPIIRSLNPLYVMEIPELAIMYVLLLFLFADPVFSFIQKRRNRRR